MIDWHPFDKTVKHNPYPHYEQTAAHMSVFRHMNLVYVLDYNNAKKILSNSNLYINTYPTSSKKYGSKSYERIIKYFVSFTQDLEQHKHLRNITQNAFPNEGLEQLILSNIQPLITHLKTLPKFDLIKDFSIPLTSNVLGKILGIPKQDRTLLNKWSSLISVVDIFYGSSVILEMEKTSNEIEVYLQKLIEGNYPYEAGLIKNLISYYKKKNTPIDEAKSQIISLVAMLIVTGTETLVSAIGNMVYTLLKTPTQWTHLRANINQLPIAIEELLRFEPPVQFTMRQLIDNTTLNGLDLKKGQLIAICLAAANRDKGRFKNADTLQLDRRLNPHLGFGAGIHYCFGAKLARIQLKLGLSALLEHFPNLELASPDEIPIYKPYNVIKSFEYLKIMAL